MCLLLAFEEKKREKKDIPTTDDILDSIICQLCDQRKADYIVEAATRIFGVYCVECCDKAAAELVKDLIDENYNEKTDNDLLLRFGKRRIMPEDTIRLLHQMYGHDD